MSSSPDYAAENRRAWDGLADEYQQMLAPYGASGGLTWGWWRSREEDLGILGDVADKAVLDLGCGAAQGTARLARLGARPVGLDSSAVQLGHARRVLREWGVALPLVLGDAERLPFAGGRFDMVISDWGALTFTDPRRAVPEAARVLRPGGLLVFCTSSPFGWVCADENTDLYEASYGTGTMLTRAYFTLDRWRLPNGIVQFQLPYGAWIRLFRAHGLIVEDLVEPRPPAGQIPAYLDEQRRWWATRWPFECIWKARKH